MSPAVHGTANPDADEPTTAKSASAYRKACALELLLLGPAGPAVRLQGGRKIGECPETLGRDPPEEHRPVPLEPTTCGPAVQVSAGAELPQQFHGCRRGRAQRQPEVDIRRRHHAWLPRPLALSSGESEYYAMLRCATECVGLDGLIADVRRLTPKVLIWTDATRRLVLRAGHSRMNHMESRLLRLQERVAAK